MRQPLVVTVGPDHADLPGFSQRSIQAALDHVALLGGGTVRLLAGRYELRNAVHLRSGVRLEGEGEDTLLVKTPEVSSPLAEDTDWYERVVRVADPRGFQVGDGVVLQGEPPHGGPDSLHKVKATIIAIDGPTLTLDRCIAKNYWTDHPASVSTLFPLLWGQEAHDLEIAALRLDGNRAQNRLLDGNHAGCIFFEFVERARIEGVTACGNHGDGISWQVAHDVQVLGCHIHDNANLGLHPGSGSQRPVIRGNHSHHNGQGLFFCWGVKHGLAEDNVLEDNADFGISIGHRDTDNVVRGNTIRRNGKAGVVYRPEAPPARLPHRNTFEGNLIVDNGETDSRCGLWLRDRVEGTVLRRNRFADTGAGRQLVGVRIDAEVVDLVMDDNIFDRLETPVEDRRAGSG